MARTIDGLRQMQALPLDLKIRMSETRIRQWVDEFGEDGVFIGFSGGKDSTVLLHLVRNIFPNVKAVFVNTGLEYPEIVQFVKTFENVEIIRPKMNFKKVIQKYGYPFISKEVSQKVSEHRNNPDGYTNVYFTPAEEGGKSEMYNMSRYKFLLDAPFKISNKCCYVMKKTPAHSYATKTGMKPITGEMADESMLRTSNWLRHGCNMYDTKHPKSAPLSFWTEQDVFQYIKKNDVKICSVYGDIVQDEEHSKLPEGQLCFMSDEHILTGKMGELIEMPCKYKTTKCDRTGCMFCGYGSHLEKPGAGRFERIKITHPKLYEWIMKPMEEGGLGYKFVIDWLNEHGGFDIRY